MKAREREKKRKKTRQAKKRKYTNIIKTVYLM